MKNAMVVGGYSHHVRGAWADALRGVGVEVKCCYTADQDFRGLPHKMPKGIDVVLVVAGSCSHKASNRAKDLAQSAGVRCETVSKDVARTVQWLASRGYAKPVQIETPENKQEEQVPIVYKPAAPQPEPQPAPQPQSEMLDYHQIKALLDLTTSQFYEYARFAGAGPKHPFDEPVYETRSYPDAKGNLRPRKLQVYSLEDVAKIEQCFKERKKRTAPAPVIVTDSPVSDPPVTFEQVFGHPVNIKPVELPPTDNLDWLIKSLHRMTEELAEAAVRERNEWRAKCEAVELERDALRAQLERIKSALGV